MKVIWAMSSLIPDVFGHFFFCGLASCFVFSQIPFLNR